MNGEFRRGSACRIHLVPHPSREVGQPARRRIATRIIPYIFLLSIAACRGGA